MTNLAEELDSQLDSIGFAKETRRFTGHLTVCRIKNTKDGFELAKAVDGFGPFDAGTADIDSVTVYQSELTRSGPVIPTCSNCLKIPISPPK